MMTSSISCGSRFSARRTASFTAAAPSSTGCIPRRVPRGARPTAVLAPETITASFILLSSSVPEWFAGLEHVLDALVGLLVLEEVQERLLLQLQKVVLRHPLGHGEVAAGQDARGVSGYDAVVLGGVAAPLEGLYPHLQRGSRRLAGCVDVAVPLRRRVAVAEVEDLPLR